VQTLKPATPKHV